jgi:hypothetical protein
MDSATKASEQLTERMANLCASPQNLNGKNKYIAERPLGYQNKLDEYVAGEDGAHDAFENGFKA